MMLSFTVIVAVDDKCFNQGMHLKTEAKKLKVLVYFRCGETGWEYSEEALDFVKEYNAKSLSLSE